MNPRIPKILGVKKFGTFALDRPHDNSKFFYLMNFNVLTLWQNQQILYDHTAFNGLIINFYGFIAVIVLCVRECVVEKYSEITLYRSPDFVLWVEFTGEFL